MGGAREDKKERERGVRGLGWQYEREGEEE
jgi:hypothetical protein